MMKRNASRSEVEIETGIELAHLLGAAMLGAFLDHDGSAAGGEVAASSSIERFQNETVIAGLRELVCGGHSTDAGTQYGDGLAGTQPRIKLRRPRPRVGGSDEPERLHGLVHRRDAADTSDHF